MAQPAAAKILRGTAAFHRTNLALFSAGFSTFALMYCLQPLMPLFSHDFHVSAAQSSLCISLTTGCLAVSMLLAGGLSEAWGRKPIMVLSLFVSATLTIIAVICAVIFWRSLPPSLHFDRHGLVPSQLLHLMAEHLGDSRLRWLYCEGFLLMGTFVTLYNYIGFRLVLPPYRLSQGQIGLIFTVYLVGAFSSAWVGNLAGRLGRGKVLWLIISLMLAGLAITLAGRFSSLSSELRSSHSASSAHTQLLAVGWAYAPAILRRRRRRCIFSSTISDRASSVPPAGSFGTGSNGGV